MLLVISKLDVLNLLIYNQRMHNLYAIFAKFLEICKHFGKTLVNEKGNQPRRGVVPRFSDLEVIALSLTAESVEIDSENNLFVKLFSEYHSQMPNLISRRQFNDRRKQTAGLCKLIREKMANTIDGGEEYFCIDSKPIEVCWISRGKRVKWAKAILKKLLPLVIVLHKAFIITDINCTLSVV